MKSDLSEQMSVQKEYLSMEYGPPQHLPCNVHSSSGTIQAQRPHYHDFYQIYYVTRGNLTHCTERETVTVRRGDSFIVPPYYMHYIDVKAGSPVFYSFSFYRDFLPEYILQDPDIQYLFSALATEQLRPDITLSEDMLLPMEQLMTMAEREFYEKKQGWMTALQSLLVSILILLARAYAKKPEKAALHNEVIIRCLEYIREHYFEALDIERMKSLSYMSATTFYRTFKQYTGQTFVQYISSMRIRKACILLSQPEHSIEEIASHCGYTTYSTFYRAFCREMHMTPQQYRTSHYKTVAKDLQQNISSS